MDWAARYEDAAIDDGGAIGNSGVQRILCSENVVRQAGLPRGYATDFPSLHHPPHDALCPMILAASEVRLVDKIDHPAMACIESRVSFLATQGVGVDWERAIIDGGEERIRRIV